MENQVKQRRSLKYIRLAAFLAGQPDAAEELTLSLLDIEEVVGEKLPPNARFPSWWRNDDRKMHARAWLSAGWEVAQITGGGQIVFARRSDRSE